MIIVSQDKDMIINFENVVAIEIEECIDKFSLEVNLLNNDHYGIAIYETEERAKEVLQEIVYEFRKCTTISDKYGNVMQCCITPRMYEMPKE